MDNNQNNTPVETDDKNSFNFKYMVAGMLLGILGGVIFGGGSGTSIGAGLAIGTGLGIAMGTLKT